MENPVDHTLDLGLVNYVKHPENRNYIVFRLADEDRAEAFEQELITGKIWYEKGDEMKRSRKFILFGIHKNDFNAVQQINYMVEARFKKPFIPFAAFRWALILFSLTVLVLATLGYCEAQRKLETYDTSLKGTEEQK
jgi:hypothetical protein